MVKDYYYILGVSKTASTEEIKKAFRKLSLKFHPDKNEGDSFFEERFKEINEAYGILSDQKKRADYDRVIAETVPGYTPPPKPPTPEPPKSTPPPPEPPKPPAAPIKEKTDSNGTLFMAAFIFIAFALFFLLPQKKQEYSGPALSYDTPQREQSEPVVVDAPKSKRVIPPAEVDLFPFIKTFKIPEGDAKALYLSGLNVNRYEQQINKDILAGGERKNRRIIHTYKFLDQMLGGTYYTELAVAMLPDEYDIDVVKIDDISVEDVIVTVPKMSEVYAIVIYEYVDANTKEYKRIISDVINCGKCRDEDMLQIKETYKNKVNGLPGYGRFLQYQFYDYASAVKRRGELLIEYQQ